MRQNERRFGKFKQGQTVYAVHTEWDLNDNPSTVLNSYFLHSHKELLPKDGEKIVSMNESYLNWINSEIGGSFLISLSRRKAVKMLEIERKYWIDEGFELTDTKLKEGK